MKKLYTIFILILILFACNNVDKQKSTFTVVLPDTSVTHQPDIFYERKKKAEQELMLNKLENGSNSFELRLWAKVEVLMSGQLFVIRKIKNDWTCLHYNYFYKRNLGSENSKNFIELMTNFTIDTFWVKKLQPRTNWRTFFNAIAKEDIYNLPTQSEIKGWKNKVHDGYTFSIEFATKEKYKFYSYNCPDIYENQFKECKHMSNILSVFNKEFGLRMGIFGEDKYRCLTK
jgi:hypothetical protein